VKKVLFVIDSISEYSGRGSRSGIEPPYFSPSKESFKKLSIITGVGSG